ncbi:long-chain fatty acid transport protein 6 [Latimeria chalumnae]|uniref:long-chain-fatty-acid--CoA ligase n=1 Tax=Latimeria chalumnae TaxID=7897 RepID=H3A0P1_LATCH|nr:PREDICTED: long-chain fatty acid transport protein 6-like [Latimeria chalumnae]|eukprot:XP_006013010.1 PREDICTED: long-chain fatty acid transport protein 6-like [Latimeria chalumnae]
MFGAILTVLAAGGAALWLLQKWVYPYFWADLMYYIKLSLCLREAKCRIRKGNVTFLSRFACQVEKIPQKPFLIYEGDVYTYQDVDRRSNKVAQVFLQQAGLKKGETVAMLMSNEPDFVWVWFGLSKIGCTVAFLNSNIRSRSLLHCFNSCEAKTLVVGEDLVCTLENILPELQKNGISVWVSGKVSNLQGVESLLDKMEAAPSDPVPLHLLLPTNPMSTFLYIFTSGTTGLPKAAFISHLKAVMCLCFLGLCGINSSDVVYITLPLYHMTASLLGIGGCIELGATCVLKKKFSVNQFWNDCKKYNVTVFQYIGELCRYLVNQPMKDGEKDHRVRIATGSGLRPDVWKKFIERFGKIKVYETYGMTEANINFINYTNKIGPIGRAGFFNKKLFPFVFVKYDVQKREPVRNEQGRCIKVNNGETGLLIMPVTRINPFLGYAGSRDMSEKKLLRDVFEKGDAYLNTGDLMVQDSNDFVYFRDRIGDTFRWKGENVATTEVADHMEMLDFIQEANVYGVAVPGREGRAGMAAIVLEQDHDFDAKRLYSHVLEFLPSYARPYFIRVQDSMDTTATFKLQKVQLVEEGFDLSVICEPLYFLDGTEKSYIPLTKQIYNDILSGQKRL